MARSDHQEPNNPGNEGQEFEPFMFDIAGPTSSPDTPSASGQFSGAEMEFEPFMFNPGEVAHEAAPQSPAPSPEPVPVADTAPAPVPVTGHAVPPPSYLNADSPAARTQPETFSAPSNGAAYHTSPDPSTVMAGRSRGNTGPLAAERLGAAPSSWSDHSLASIEDFSAVLIAVQAGKKMLQSGPLHAALPSPVATGVQAQAPSNTATMQQSHGMDMEQMPQWAPQATPSMQTAPPEAPPPFIAGADPSSPWAMDQPEWASGAAHAAVTQPEVAEAEGDSGLPPWLIEEAETPAPEMAAPTVAPEPEVETEQAPPMQQAEERPELVSSAFTGTTGVGIQAPESTLGEATLEAEAEVVDALQNMDNEQPRGLDGEAIEFEGFMFDQGTPAPIPNLRGESGALASEPLAPFTPPPSGPAGMVVDQDEHVEGESLPFWLNDAAEVEVTPGEGYVEGAEAAAHASQPLKMESVTPAAALEDDFADLPPVQPFDFTQIAEAVEDEPLGFNTEELIGTPEGERDPMVVTANLEALADLIGGPVPRDIDPRSRPAAASQALADDVAPDLVAHQYADVDEVDEVEDAGEFDVEPFEAEDMSWMSTVTTDLAASGLADALPAMPSTPATPPPTAVPPTPVMASAQDSTGLSGVLDVTPFDISDVDVEEESATSHLDQTPTVGPSTDRLDPKQVWSGPPTEPRMDEQYMGAEAETATSVFTGVPSEADERYEEADAPTSRLGSPEGGAPPDAAAEQTAAPAPEQPEPGFFKARVARGQWSSNVPLVTPQASMAGSPDDAPPSPWAGGQTGMRAAMEQPAEEEPQPRPEEQTQVRQEQPQPQMQAQAQAAVQSPLQAQEQATEFEMPRPGDILVSGPLPSLTGYEDLVELMEKNPQDTGSYMAMATAYVNAGEMESALRVYRRLIKRPGVSAMLLGMIDEELDDLRASAGNLPRYHQVRGDLYLKLGRHREAIEEYNKLV
jgi:hypothetical protein